MKTARRSGRRIRWCAQATDPASGGNRVASSGDDCIRRTRWLIVGVGSLAVIVVTSLAAGCGGGADRAATLASVEQTEPGGEVLESIADAIGVGGWVTSASRPEGGAVLAGAATPTEGRDRFDPSGVVLDRAGVPVVEFALPQPVLVIGIVAGEDRAVLAGVACEGTSREDENTGERDCSPGTAVGYQVDLRSGEVVAVDLPDEVQAAGGLMTGLPMSLYRSGPDAIILVANVGGATGLRAWRLWGASRWEPIPAPANLPCQVGDRIVVVEDGSGPVGMVDPEETQTATPSAQVFDADRDTWGEPVFGPPLEGVAGMPPAVVCSAARLVIFPHVSGSKPFDIATFDPATLQWEAREFPGADGQQAPLAHSGLEVILVYSLAVAESAAAIEYDPVTGRRRDSPLALDSYATFVPVTLSSALVFRLDGTFGRMEFA